MQKRWYVKYREYGSKESEVVRSFISEGEAEDFKSRLMSGAGGLFGHYHEIFMSDRPGRRPVGEE